MKSTFYNLLNIQLGVTVVLLVLIILRPWLKKHFSARVRHWLWLAVVIRLCVPVSVPLGDFGVDKISVTVPEVNIYHQKMPSYAQTDIVHSPQFNTGATAVQELTSEPMIIARDNALSLDEILICIWLSVAVYKLFCHSGYIAEKDKLMKKLRYDDALTYRLTKVAYSMSIYKNVKIAWCDYNGSPMLLGFFEPVILLPEKTTNIDDIDIIITHELTHLKRNDVFFKFVINILECVYWFNPLISKMVAYACEDMEFACDEAVIRSQDNNYKADYAQSILNNVAYGGNILLATNFTSDAGKLKERFENIFNFKKMKLRYKALAGMLVMAVAATVLVACTDIGSVKLDKRELSEIRDVHVHNVIKADDIQWILRQDYALEGSVMNIRGSNGGYTCLITENPDEICTGEMLNSHSSPQEAGRLQITHKAYLAGSTGDSVHFSTGMNWLGQLQAVGYEKGVKTICRLYGIAPESEADILADVSAFMQQAEGQNDIYWHKSYGNVNLGIHYWNYSTGCVEIILMDNEYFNNWLDKIDARQQAIENSKYDDVILPADDFPSDFRQFRLIYDEEIYGGWLNGGGMKKNRGAYDYFCYVSKDCEYEINFAKVVDNYGSPYNTLFTVNTICGERGNGVSLTTVQTLAYDSETVYSFLKDLCYMFNPMINSDVVYNRFVADIENGNYETDYICYWAKTINGVTYYMDLSHSDETVSVGNIYVMDETLAQFFMIGPKDGDGQFHYN